MGGAHGNNLSSPRSDKEVMIHHSVFTQGEASLLRNKEECLGWQRSRRRMNTTLP